MVKKLAWVLLYVIVLTACGKHDSSVKPEVEEQVIPSLESVQDTTVAWFVDMGVSRASAYRRIVTRPAELEGRKVLQTITETFSPPKGERDSFITRTVEEWTELDGSLIRLTEIVYEEKEVRIEVRPEELRIEIRRQGEEVEKSSFQVSEDLPVYASWLSFLLSSRFRSFAFYQSPELHFLDVGLSWKKPVYPVQRTIKPLEERERRPWSEAAYEFVIDNSERVCVSEELQILSSRALKCGYLEQIFDFENPPHKQQLPKQVEKDFSGRPVDFELLRYEKRRRAIPPAFRTGYGW